MLRSGPKSLHLERLGARTAPREPSATRVALSTTRESHPLEDFLMGDLKQLVITQVAEMVPRQLCQQVNDFQRGCLETQASPTEEQCIPLE